MIKKTFFTIFIFISFSLFARDITITVKDNDLDLPLEGATVRVWDGNQYVCDKDGKAVITVPDRQIIVQAAYPGYETGRIVVPTTGDSFEIKLRLSGIMQSRELIIEGTRPGTSDSRTGRSVAVGEKEISQTAEIGIIEDVMSTIKLLPGVSYTGLFNAQPSIRGGLPGDFIAAYDGFYVNSPYHWGGGYSIFDPRMVQHAQLSHGVFSARYGNTISGLLEISSKKPSPTETTFELGVNTSAANFNLSLPIYGRGGISFMGRLTYYDPVVELFKLVSKSVPALDAINSVRQAPYIRSFTINGNYRFTDNFEFISTGFIGLDGVGVSYNNLSRTNALISNTSLDFDFKNIKSFLTSTLFWNPRTDMLLKLTLGAGYDAMNIDGVIIYNINREFSGDYGLTGDYVLNNRMLIEQTDSAFNAQGRLDYDWEINNNVLISFGVQEIMNTFKSYGDQGTSYDRYFSNLPEWQQKDFIDKFLPSTQYPKIDSSFFENPNLRISIPADYSPDINNNLFTSSFYGLTEISTNDKRINTELGLRLDHFYLSGDGFTASSDFTLNPRFNIDYIVLKNKGIFESISLSLGTGLFSSISSIVASAEKSYNITHIKPNRSWTSIAGVKFEFPEALTLNIEAYYKRVFDRMYIPVSFDLDGTSINPYFDGKGIIWGIDVMLHKIQGRYWNGWLTYSYNWTKYKDPHGQHGGMGIDGGNQGRDWYYPDYHRFHNLNLVFNYQPIQIINLYFRFGIFSGSPLIKYLTNKPERRPVLIIDDSYNPKNAQIIEKYYWDYTQDSNNRYTPSMLMDFKFSLFGSNKTGKTTYELYFAIENILSLFYTSQGNTTFNQYTGEVDQGGMTASYEIPIPIPSFGFKISY